MNGTAVASILLCPEPTAYSSQLFFPAYHSINQIIFHVLRITTRWPCQLHNLTGCSDNIYSQKFKNYPNSTSLKTPPIQLSQILERFPTVEDGTALTCTKHLSMQRPLAMLAFCRQPPKGLSSSLTFITHCLLINCSTAPPTMLTQRLVIPNLLTVLQLMPLNHLANFMLLLFAGEDMVTAPVLLPCSSSFLHSSKWDKIS